MGEYKFSGAVDKTKIFITGNHNLKGRIDSFFYKYEFQELEKRLLQSPFKTIYLKQLIKSITNGFDFRDYKTTGTPYIKVANVKKGEFDFSKIQCIDIEANQLTKKIQLKKGNLILTRKGTYGNALALNNDYDYVISSEVFYIELKQELVNSKYLEIFFNSNSGQRQFTRYSIGAIMGSLSQEALRYLQIPLPPLEIQQKIVAKCQKAYNQKQIKEKEAKELLTSIDTYLLNELGITMPVIENSLESRVFKVNFSEISGERFDAFAVLNKDYKIEGGKYENYRLRQIAEVQKGQSITSAKIIDGDYPVIAGGQSSPYSHNVYNYENNAITVSASGAYAGFVWYHNTPIFASDCSVIQSKDENNVSTLFLAEVLKTKQKEIYNLQQGAGQPHVYSSDLVKLNIPVPPKEKQNKIINHILEIRAKAKQLKKEAKNCLEIAKKDIEQLIL